MGFCTQCGKKQTEKTNYCIYCGFDLRNVKVSNDNSINQNVGLIEEQTVASIDSSKHNPIMRGKKNILKVFLEKKKRNTFLTLISISIIGLSVFGLNHYIRNQKVIAYAEERIKKDLFGYTFVKPEKLHVKFSDEEIKLLEKETDSKPGLFEVTVQVEWTNPETKKSEQLEWEKRVNIQNGKLW